MEKGSGKGWRVTLVLVYAGFEARTAAVCFRDVVRLSLSLSPSASARFPLLVITP